VISSLIEELVFYSNKLDCKYWIETKFLVTWLEVEILILSHRISWFLNGASIRVHFDLFVAEIFRIIYDQFTYFITSILTICNIPFNCLKGHQGSNQSYLNQTRRRLHIAIIYQYLPYCIERTVFHYRKYMQVNIYLC
jgi:hypothetical protein